MKPGPSKGITLSMEHRRKIGEANKRRFLENPDTRRRVLSAVAHARLFRAPAKYGNESGKDGSRRKRYGLTAEEFRAILASQDGKCAICAKPLEDTAGKRAVDHDHQTGAVRGLLCVPCNGSLGWFERHSEAASRYLASRSIARAV